MNVYRCEYVTVYPVSKPASQSKPTTKRNIAERKRHSRSNVVTTVLAQSSEFTWFVYVKPESVF